MLSIAAFAGAASAAAPAADHPVLGRWSVSTVDGTCTETYRFAADGTAVITSGQQLSQIAFDIAPAAGDRGFYRFNGRSRTTTASAIAPAGR